jgi:hypothetical protein
MSDAKTDEAFNESRRETLRQRLVERERELEALKENHNSAREGGDFDNAGYYLDEIDRIEAEQNSDAMKLARLSAPQKMPEYAQRFGERHSAFFNRHGPQAMQAAALAHDYAANRMGLTPGSQEYDYAMTTGLEMYQKELGVTFDPNETALTPDEAAKISGVSAKQYNLQVKRMYDSGHDSNSLNPLGRKVG